MTKFIIVRHGNSASNVDKTYTGHIDSPLSEVGKLQAQRVCEYLFENFKIDSIYSSDLIRAIDTVAPLAKKLKKEIITDVELRELYGGKWEGLKFLDLPDLFPKDYKVWVENVGFARPTGGESYPELQARAVHAIKKIAKEQDGKTVVVSTHGGLIRALQCAVCGVDLSEMQNVPYVVNASISTFLCGGENFTNGVFDFNEYLEGLYTSMPKGI